MAVARRTWYFTVNQFSACFFNQENKVFQTKFVFKFRRNMSSISHTLTQKFNFLPSGNRSFMDKESKENNLKMYNISMKISRYIIIFFENNKVWNTQNIEIWKQFKYIFTLI